MAAQHQAQQLQANNKLNVGGMSLDPSNTLSAANLQQQQQQQNQQPQQAGLQQNNLQGNQAAFTLQQREQLKRFGANNQAQLMALARQHQQNRTPGGLNAANLQQFLSQGLNTPGGMPPNVQAQLFAQLQQSQQKQQQQTQAQQPPGQQQQVPQQQNQMQQAAQNQMQQQNKPAALPGQTQNTATGQQATPNLGSTPQPQIPANYQIGGGQQAAGSAPGFLRAPSLPNEDDFLHILRTLHSNPGLQYPVVEGKQINLYKLFAYVLTCGGYRVVSFFKIRQLTPSSTRILLKSTGAWPPARLVSALSVPATTSRTANRCRRFTATTFPVSRTGC
jgi:hypothetical protein